MEFDFAEVVDEPLRKFKGRQSLSSAEVNMLEVVPPRAEPEMRVRRMPVRGRVATTADLPQGISVTRVIRQAVKGALRVFDQAPARVLARHSKRITLTC